MYATQTQIVKEHMEKHGGITSLEAFRLYDITRLSASIFILRRRGLDIASTRETSVKNGVKKHYCRYFIKKEK